MEVLKKIPLMFLVTPIGFDTAKLFKPTEDKKGDEPADEGNSKSEAEMMKLVDEFKQFVKDAIHAGVREEMDDLAFLGACLDVFRDQKDEDAAEENQSSDKVPTEKSKAIKKAILCDVADEFTNFLNTSLETEDLNDYEDAHDFFEGSALRFLKSKGRLR